MNLAASVSNGLNAAIIGLASAGPLDYVKGLFGHHGTRTSAPRFPSPLTDPAVGLLGDKLAFLIGVVFFFGALLMTASADTSKLKGRRFKAVGLLSMIVTGIFFIAGIGIAKGNGSGDIPFERGLDVLSGAAVYGAGVLLIGSIITFMLGSGEE